MGANPLVDSFSTHPHNKMGFLLVNLDKAASVPIHSALYTADQSTATKKFALILVFSIMYYSIQ